MEASISVVIPTHNRPEGLVRSLDSILNQTVMPEQVVIVDDGSTPSVSVDVFAAFPDSVRCTLLRNEKPQGGNNARNKGIIAAEGKYVAFLDDDSNFEQHYTRNRIRHTILPILKQENPQVLKKFKEFQTSLTESYNFIRTFSNKFIDSNNKIDITSLLKQELLIKRETIVILLEKYQITFNKNTTNTIAVIPTKATFSNRINFTLPINIKI